MKKFFVLAVAVASIISMTSCKGSESAFKKAYEKSKAQQTETPVVNETPVQVTPVQTTNTTDYSNVAVRSENVTVVTGSPLKAYSVVVGAYSIKANAEATQNFLSGNGYAAQIVLNEERGLFRVVAFTSDSKAEAAQKRDVVKNLRNDFAEAWLLYRK